MRDEGLKGREDGRWGTFRVRRICGQSGGFGGVFLKARDPEALSRWYAEHLGIPAQDGGSLAFDGPESTGMTVFAHFPADTNTLATARSRRW